MKGSLRRQAILGGIGWAVVFTIASGLSLNAIYVKLSTERYDQQLQSRHLELVRALGNSGGDLQDMEGVLTDPAYQRPYSGSYWQIDGPADFILTSPSLFDTALDVPDAADPTPRFWEGQGPDEPVRGIYQQVTIEDGTEWMVTVAETLQSLMAERAEMRRSLFLALGFFGLLGVLGASLWVMSILRPLNALREDVARRWDEDVALDPSRYPDEVAPLVSDIEELLARNRSIVEQARRQTADLAHSLKTPLAALRNELENQPRSDTAMAGALEAFSRVEAQVRRSLGRLRIANSAAVYNGRCDLAHSAERLSRLFNSLPSYEEIALSLDVQPDLIVAADAQDVEELLGSLLENAFKWANSAVRLSAVRAGRLALIQIEDDGPGIPDERHDDVIKSGVRLDTLVPGTGLGLSIALDLAQAYGGTLKLSRSATLGGLKVEITLPVVARGMNKQRREAV